MLSSENIFCQKVFFQKNTFIFVTSRKHYIFAQKYRAEKSNFQHI
jgi:hypothetical protein